MSGARVLDAHELELRRWLVSARSVTDVQEIERQQAAYSRMKKRSRKVTR